MWAWYDGLLGAADDGSRPTAYRAVVPPLPHNCHSRLVHGANPVQVRDVGNRVAIDHEQIGDAATFDGSERSSEANGARWYRCNHLQHVEWRIAGHFNQRLRQVGKVVSV